MDRIQNKIDLHIYNRGKMCELKVFYTLPSSSEDPPYLRWDEDPSLRRYVLALVADLATQIEVFTVAQILIQRLPQLPSQRQDYTLGDRVHSGCMTALLSSIVLSTALSRWMRFYILPKLEMHGSSMEIGDIYALGLEILSDPASFLRNYHPGNLDTYDRLCAFSHRKFQQSTIDRLRNISELRNFARTNLGLLVRSRWSKVKKALIEAGEQGERLVGLSLLHQCLQETVTANQFETRDPQATHYAALLARYRERATATDFDIADLDRIEKLLVLMGNALRSYELPKITSLDLPVGNDLTGKTTTLGDFVEATPIDILSTIEIQAQSQQLRQVVVSSLDRLAESDPLADRVLFLLYGLELTQANAGVELGIDQATVMRRRDRTIARLAEQLLRNPNLACEETELARQRYEQLSTQQKRTAKELEPYINYVKPICEDYYSNRAQQLEN
jgi:hypothetical protein